MQHLLSMVFHTSDDNQITIPDHGMIFDDECHVLLPTWTLYWILWLMAKKKAIKDASA